MIFGYPFLLWGLLALPLLAFFFARAEQRGTDRLAQFVAARLLPQLAGTVNRGRRIFRFALLLLVLALVDLDDPAVHVEQDAARARRALVNRRDDGSHGREPARALALLR